MGLLLRSTRNIDIASVLFPTAYVAESDPSFNWVMHYLAQDAEVQKQIKSCRVLAADSRESKCDSVISKFSSAKANLVTKSEASFVTDEIVAKLIPVDGEYFSI